MTTPPWLTTGQPSTIRVWRALALDMWGPDSPAVEFLDQVRTLGTSLDDPVYLPERQMLALLRSIHRKGLE
jgi:hypothetical protein